MTEKKDFVAVLDDIVATTISSIEDSSNEIKEISSMAKNEYEELLEEYFMLKISAKDLIEEVEKLKKEYDVSKNKLVEVNKNFSKHTEVEMQEIYKATDDLRLKLAVEMEKESQLIVRRNELEVRLKSVKHLSDKADTLASNFQVASTILNGNIKKIVDELGSIKNKQLWAVKIITAQEEERLRIAREMHDGPAQSLLHLVLEIEYMIKLIDSDIDFVHSKLYDLSDFVRDIIEEIRIMIYNLRPMSIDDLGLIPTLERDIARINTEKQTRVELLINEKDQEVFKSLRNEENNILILSIYRIISEGINNAIKHARADNVLVKIHVQDKKIFLSIADDGEGFDPSEKDHNDISSGFGLSMMRERVELLYGDYAIKTKKGLGTRIIISIPLQVQGGIND